MTTTTLTEQHHQYERDLLDGTVFTRSAMAVGSIYGYQPPMGPRDMARIMQGIAAFADYAPADGSAHLAGEVLASIGRRVGLTQAQFEEAAWKAAADAVRSGWFDAVYAGSPEGPRHDECERRYNVRVLLAALDAFKQVLHYGTTSGIGWVALDLVVHHKVRRIG